VGGLFSKVVERISNNRILPSCREIQLLIQFQRVSSTSNDSCRLISVLTKSGMPKPLGGDFFTELNIAANRYDRL
jgi:hypothetical protein